MKRRITITLLTLSLLLGLALWGQGRGVTAAKAMQAVTYPLNPSNFTSLGASPFTSGTYTIDASMDNAAPRLLQGTTVIATGVFHDPNPTVGIVLDEIAVFTFDSISIPAGVTVQGAQNANSRPIALLSKTLISIDGVLDVSGAEGLSDNSSTVGGTGGAAGPGGGGGGGSGGGGGGGGGGGRDSEAGGGGAFGGNGGTTADGVAGGTAYGDLGARLQGGSGGGGSGGNDNSSGPSGVGGGGGGGALEVGAVAGIIINGNVRANGGSSPGKLFTPAVARAAASSFTAKPCSFPARVG